MRRFLFLPTILVFVSSINAQTLKQRPVYSGQTSMQPPQTLPSIPMNVPRGTPIKVVINKEVRVRHVGQPIIGKTIEPIYVFDKLLVPSGSEVVGKITQIDSVSPKMRTLSALNADFSPERTIHIEFDQLVLPDRRRLTIDTVVSPVAGTLRFISPKDTKQSSKKAASGKFAQAKQDITQQMDTLKKQISKPDKIRRLERFALSQSPFRPQYLDAGTRFNADIQEGLSFGSEPLHGEMVSKLGTLPPSGGVVRAWLTTPLDSAASKKGDPVEAIVSEPLLVGHSLYLPEGSKLEGMVLQVRKARRLGRSGQLRISFREVALPNGLEQEIDATLEGLEVGKGENLALDSENGAQVKTPKTRYLTTGIAVVLAASSATPDEDNGGVHGGVSGGAGGGAVNGASGFKLVGTLVGMFARSQVVTIALGAYGAERSVYSHFLARGRDVVYPKDMSMVLALGPQKNFVGEHSQDSGK